MKNQIFLCNFSWHDFCSGVRVKAIADPGALRVSPGNGQLSPHVLSTHQGKELLLGAQHSRGTQCTRAPRKQLLNVLDIELVLVKSNFFLNLPLHPFGKFNLVENKLFDQSCFLGSASEILYFLYK